MPKKMINTKEVVTTWTALNANVSATARQMKISRRTVYEHLARAGYFEWRRGGPGHIQFRRHLPRLVELPTSSKEKEWKTKWKTE